ncbi:hypothetical protein ACFYX0_40910, partial [Streptomyces sp. NPDC002573]
TSPQQLGGYTYAADNPITGSDPTGLMGCESPDECGGGAQLGNNWPTLHSGGKPLNDPSWGCNGCDGNSYNGSHNYGEDTGTYGGSGGLVSHAAKKAALPVGMAAGVYQTLMWYINQYREKAAASSAGKSNGDYTLVVAQVETDDPVGEDPFGIRYVVIASSGIKGELKQELEGLDVVVVNAEEKGVHAEEVAAAYREDTALQEKDLGGKITKVRNAYVTTRVCGPKCANALGKFLGLNEEESAQLENTNGMLEGKLVDKGYLNAARSALGLKPGRGSAMRVVTRYLGGLVGSQGMAGGAEEDDK